MKRGISEEIVEHISKINKDPNWMLDIRMKAYDKLISMKTNLPFDINAMQILPEKTNKPKWEDVPKEIRDMYDKLNISDTERQMFLGGMAHVNALETFSPIYSRYLEQLRKKGVVFESISDATHNHPSIVKKYFTHLMDWNDLISLLNTAAWFGGTLFYVPKGVKLQLPVQTFYFINMDHTTQFERVLIILEEGAEAHYVEGCSAPMYSNGSLHLGVGEMFVSEHAKLKVSSVQNWSKNMSVIAKKRAQLKDGANIVWVDANFGAKSVDKHPTIFLEGNGASAEILSVSNITKGQKMDTGGKVIHKAKNTKSLIQSKAVCYESGRDIFNGLVEIQKGANGSIGHMSCDTIMIGNGYVESHPNIRALEKDASITHEASAGKIDDEVLFYLATRGLNEENAVKLIVSGFIDNIIKQLPMELAVGLKKVLNMDFKNAVG